MDNADFTCPCSGTDGRSLCCERQGVHTEMPFGTPSHDVVQAFRSTHAMSSCPIHRPSGCVRRSLPCPLQGWEHIPGTHSLLLDRRDRFRSLSKQSTFPHGGKGCTGLALASFFGLLTLRSKSARPGCNVPASLAD